MRNLFGVLAILVVLGLMYQHPWLTVVPLGLWLLHRSTRSTAHARTSYHSHASPSYMKKTYLHEGGHIVAAKKLRAKVYSAFVYPDGSGVTHVGPARSVVDEIAISWAGQFAAGTSRGCSGDQALIRRSLRQVPRKERRSVARQGKALGRRLGRSGSVRKYARRLEKKGHL